MYDYDKMNPIIKKHELSRAQEAEAEGFWVQSQAQKTWGTKQLSETLSLNKIQNRAGDVAHWSSAPEFNPLYPQNKKT